MERKRRENNRIMAEIVELKAKQAARGLPVAPRPPPSSGKRFVGVAGKIVAVAGLLAVAGSALSCFMG